MEPCEKNVISKLRKFLFHDTKWLVWHLQDYYITITLKIYLFFTYEYDKEIPKPKKY